MSPAIVTWEAVSAWRREMDIELDPPEVLVLVRLGREDANAQAERINKATKA
jgi:hypothetical protein